MSLCPFIIDESTTPKRCVSGALPRLVMSTAPELDITSEVPTVQRIKAASKTAKIDDILRYLKQLGQLFTSGGDGVEPVVDMNKDIRSRRFSEAHTDDIDDTSWMCRWRMEEPWMRDFVTTTILDEMSVIEWIYAMRCLDEGFGAMRESKPSEAGRWFVNSTAAFKLLARTGAREGCVRFSSGHPPMFKAYVCQAWALLAHAYSHIAAANVAFNSHNSADSISQLCFDGIKHGVCAGKMAALALDIIRNESGMDSLHKTLITDFAHACIIITAWGKFQAAIYYYYDASTQDNAKDHMNHCIAVCGNTLDRNSAAMTKSMIDTRTALTYEAQGYISGLLTSFKGVVSRSEPEALPDVPDSQVQVPTVLPERLLFPAVDT